MSKKLILSLLILSLAILAPLSLGSVTKYQFNKDGTVRDNTTDLVWQKSYRSGLKWDDAVRYCGDLKIRKHSNWRLPTLNELQSIVEQGKSNPAINTRYFRSSTGEFWSSSVEEDITDEKLAWMVFFTSGLAGFDQTSSPKAARCVRNAH